MLAGRCHTLAENYVGHFEAVDLLGLDADEVLAAHELAVEVGEDPSASHEELVVGLLVFD